MVLTREGCRRGKQAFIVEMEAFPEFKILEALVQQPEASAADAVQQIVDLTTVIAASNEPGDLGVHPWHTFKSLIEVAKRNTPSRHAKLVECIAQLQGVRVTDPRTGEPLKHKGYLVWEQLPALGYTIADEWNSCGRYIHCLPSPQRRACLFACAILIRIPSNQRTCPRCRRPQHPT